MWEQRKKTMQPKAQLAPFLKDSKAKIMHDMPIPRLEIAADLVNLLFKRKVKTVLYAKKPSFAILQEIA